MRIGSMTRTARIVAWPASSRLTTAGATGGGGPSKEIPPTPGEGGVWAWAPGAPNRIAGAVQARVIESGAIRTFVAAGEAWYPRRGLIRARGCARSSEEGQLRAGEAGRKRCHTVREGSTELAEGPSQPRRRRRVLRHPCGLRIHLGAQLAAVGQYPSIRLRLVGDAALSRLVVGAPTRLEGVVKQSTHEIPGHGCVTEIA